MSSKKHTGSYYTPEFLSGFLMKYLAGNFTDTEVLSILEPSIGDGSFLRSFNNTIFPECIDKFSFTGIEKIETELDKAKEILQESRKANCLYDFVNIDFLEYQETIKNKFSLIVGNPPYIKKQLLTELQIDLCNKIHKSVGLSNQSIKNIWPAFLVRSCRMLEDNGVLAFVLPAELLQVNFSKELREMLISEFERTEIFTFDDLLFECKGQDTILLIAFKQHVSSGQFFSHISDINQLENNDFVLTQNNTLIDTNTKWSHHLLSSEDLEFIKELGSRLKPISYYCDSKPGIVTAANDFFIINEETETQYALKDFTRPIVQKALYLNGSVTFEKEDYEDLMASGKQTKVIVIKDEEVSSLEENILRYIQLGKDQELHKGHKCSKRKNWFVIPNISEPPQAFFFRRVHHYPKLIKNSAKTLVTDTAYKVDVRPDFDINSIIYSFYNSLSLAFAELEGRSYGGRVLELMPAEFKKIPIPYNPISNSEFKKFSKRFKNKINIEEILRINDDHILRSSLSLNVEEIERVQDINRRLFEKRFKKNNFA